ncbi:hypothetical protein GGR42_001370 [Saonia flava]|uniref:Uncharacterized protein n=1 Tax=Saonia flava TaxID=523696 RepID=A0A846QS65_9FLAO|nr:hypothetical protein [Saonia flava]NJB70908.1 hypothetical protein [Saonia flava]
MKNYYFSIVTFFLVLALKAQTPNYSSTLDIELGKYNIKSKAIQNKLFKENITTAFSHVIFSNSDLASNTSAFGYTQDEEKTNVTVNGNIKLQDAIYLRLGANVTGSKSIFEFYSDGSWRNNVGLNLGLILNVGKPVTFFKGDEKKFKLNKARREIRGSEPIYNPRKYTKTSKTEIDSLKNDILIYYGGVLNVHKNVLDSLPDVKKLIEEKKYEEAYVKLDSEHKKVQNYLNSLATQSKLEKYVKDDILYNFDKENDMTYGYILKWLDLNVNLSNSTYKFSEENIEATILEAFNNQFDNEDANKLKTVISFNFNHTHNSEKLVWYYQIGLSASSSSFLESTLIDGTPKVVQNNSSEYILQDEEEQNLGRFDLIKENLKTGSLNAYGAIFFTKKKSFGFNASLSHSYLIDKPENVFFKNNFTALFGPIFRKTKDDNTSLTFGIDVGWSNSIYKSKVSNDFTGRIRLGIPFNIYSKKTEDKTKK